MTFTLIQKKLGRVSIASHAGKEILVLDFSDLRGDAMISVSEEAKRLTPVGSDKLLVLSIFNNKTFISRNFLRHVEQDAKEVNKPVTKQAIVGLSTVKKYILRGINMRYRMDLQCFDSVEEAMDFLVNK